MENKWGISSWWFWKKEKRNRKWESITFTKGKNYLKKGVTYRGNHSTKSIITLVRT